LPLFIIQGENIPWLLLLLLIIAPNLSALMQLALSRTREFSADMQAIKLTGDPQGLISALSKIEYYQKNWFEQLLSPSVRVPNPSLLRTHPHTKKRIRRLQKIAQHDHNPFIHETQIHPLYHKLSQRAPRRRISGLWH
jgi:heat shock protein HtpX